MSRTVCARVRLDDGAGSVGRLAARLEPHHRHALVAREAVDDHGAFSFFFFQAEDGIRDVAVTGVQTCALPISPLRGPAVRVVCRDPDRGEPGDRSAAGRQSRRPDVRRARDHRPPRSRPGGPAAPERHPLDRARGHDRSPVVRVPVRRGRQRRQRRQRRHMLGAYAARAALALALACRTGAPPVVRYDPAHDLGALFHDVQVSGIFADSKTFVDARPLEPPSEIAAGYATARTSAGFNLRSFVERHFELPRPIAAGFHTDPSQTMEQHIRGLWPVLTRPPDSADARSSLIPLPQAYVVPGGRFREIYYWDSYFTMLGLIESGRTDLVRSMLDNFAHLVATVGHIPNGNRTYYLSRSQPPFFGAMVGLYAKATDTTQALRYLDALEAEHVFWMDGAGRLGPGEAYRRVVRLPDGSVLNRYWDDRAEPRPESYRPDYDLGQTLPAGRREGFYRHVRATAESGWDFSRDRKSTRLNSSHGYISYAVFCLK